MKKVISLKLKNKGVSYCYAKVYTLVVQYCTFLSYKSVQCSMTRMYTFVIADYQIDTNVSSFLDKLSFSKSCVPVSFYFLFCQSVTILSFALLSVFV